MRPNYDAIMLVMNGIESDSRVIRTARSVQAADLSVLVIGLGKRRNDGDYEPRRVPISGLDAWVVPAPRLPAAQPGTVELGLRHRALLDDYAARVVEICGGMFPRIIHSHDMTTIAAGARLKRHFAAAGRPVKWIHDLHEWVGGLTTIAPHVRDIALHDERESIHDADRLTTVSPAIARIIASDYGLTAEPVVVLNTPLLSEFDAELDPTIRSTIGLQEGTPLAVYSGQVKAARGVHDLVASLPFSPDLHVAIVSNNTGKYVDELKDRAVRDGTEHRLHFLPYVEQGQVASFLRTADVGVHPLERYGNGDVALPNKLFEYLHAGLPVVVSDCKAMADFVITNEVGRVYEAGDVRGLADAIRRARSDRDALASKAGELRTQYTWEDQERKIHGLYAELLGVGAIAKSPPFPWHATDSGFVAGQLRIVHGVAGSAGQPWALANGLRRRGHVAHNIVTAVPRLGFRATLLVPWRRMTAGERFTFIRDLAQDFDVFHFHARSLFFERGSFRFPTLIDLLLLRLLGKVVVFHFRGSEARLGSAFAARNRFNYVDDDPYGLSEAFPEERQRKMIDFVTSVADAVYVTDPELQSYVPEAEIVPRAIDLNDWRPIGSNPSSKRPLVVHAPTRAALKGTDHLVTAVERLRGEGLDFDFVQVIDVPQEEARRLYARADVIVDQLLIGWYGVLAVEGMALGKPVVSYVRPDLVHHLGSPVPLAIADPMTIEDVLRSLLCDSAARVRLGAAGRTYVERVHSTDVVAAQLEARYRSLLERTSRPGVDYEGLAPLLEMQAEHADSKANAIARALRSLAVAESALQTEADDADVLAAERQIRFARRALEAVTTGRERSSATVPIREASPEDAREHASTSVPSSTSVPEAPPTDPPRRSAIPVVDDVIDSNGWGLASTLMRLVGRRGSEWEDVAAAAVEQPELGLELLTGFARRANRGDQSPLAAHVARCTARAFRRVENRLIVKSSNASTVESEPKIQVGFARQYYNLRTILGRDAEMIAAGLLRPTLDGGPGDDANPLGQRSDDDARTGLNDLCWYFINTAALSRTLDGSTRERYEEALGWFADRLRLWEVPAFRTTRASLGVRLPFRVIPRAADPFAAARLGVKVVGDGVDDEIRIFDRGSGDVRWIESNVATRLDRAAAWDIELRGAPGAVVSVDIPRHEFDPRRSAPRLADWHSAAMIELTMPTTIYRLEIDKETLATAPVLTAFEATASGFVSKTLNRQIEQLKTLERLHPGHGFGERAERWRGFADYWAQQPVAD